MKKARKRQQGEFELRVLKDGRLVLIAPDEELMEIAQSLAKEGEPSENPAGDAHAEG